MRMPRRRASCRKNRKYSSPFGEISLRTATPLVAVALQPLHHERGVTTAVAVAEPEAVLALESLGAGPVIRGTSISLASGATVIALSELYAPATRDAALVDQPAEPVGGVAGRAVGEAVLGVEHELVRPDEEARLDRLVEGHPMDLVVPPPGPSSAAPSHPILIGSGISVLLGS